MSCEKAEAIGRLNADNTRTKENVDSLFKSNDKRKKDVNDLELKFQSIQHTVEETNQTTNKAVGLMEELITEVKGLKSDVADIHNRVEHLEDSKFDPVKILRWLGTWRGTFFMITVSAMLIGAVFPDAREWISSLFGLAARAAQ